MLSFKVYPKNSVFLIFCLFSSLLFILLWEMFCFFSYLTNHQFFPISKSLPAFLRACKLRLAQLQNSASADKTICKAVSARAGKTIFYQWQTYLSSHTSGSYINYDLFFKEAILLSGFKIAKRRLNILPVCRWSLLETRFNLVWLLNLSS